MKTAAIYTANRNFQNSVARMAKAAGITHPSCLTPLEGGRNNRVWRLDAGGRSYLLKSYFKHAGDQRDRLAAEFAFMSYAWKCGSGQVSRPIARDRTASLGLYEYVYGRRLAPADVGDGFVAQALDFIRELNQSQHRSKATELREASEACLKISDHLSTVDRRVGLLERMEIPDRVSGEARSFVVKDLAPSWRRMRDMTDSQAKSRGIDTNRAAPRAEQCVSPSDFGAHNALLESGGRFRFIDFEYAGWDDPAKMICDFFCQPELPVSKAFYISFSQSVARLFPGSDTIAARTDLLLPAYRIKWCCILLNDFLHVGNRRRGFAGNTAAGDRKPVQLEKAQDYLKRTLASVA